VQDFDPQVQQAINRAQTLDCTSKAIDRLRSAGVSRINIDLLYGLPHQSVPSLQQTAERVVALAPDRIALFGYAHVPWLKAHQRLIDEKALPDGEQRWMQFEAAANLLQQAGYIRIGLDHFAKPDDPLAICRAKGTLRRNFQGYTTDSCNTLIGLGASAVGMLPCGYVQNITPAIEYASAVRAGRLPVARGIVLRADDGHRRTIIERLMCDQYVDLAMFGDAGEFASEFGHLDSMASDSLIERDGFRITITEQGRPFMRAICAVFDQYLARGTGRHSRAV
jgi:oxygen-independent coproporphyrinogen III oxidase